MLISIYHYYVTSSR